MSYLDIGEDKLHLAVAQSADDLVLESRSQVASRFIEGRVCERCNNGWMNDLEGEAMEILKPLIAGTMPLVSISDEERTIVAKWATKTAYVMSYAVPLKKTPEPSHLRYVKENKGAVPSRVGVFGGQNIATADFRQIQRNSWYHLTNTQPTTRIPPVGTYKIAFQFRHLMLLVAHWAGSDSELMLATGIHIPLWPQRQVNIAYHMRLPPLDMGDPMAPLDRFSGTLGVCDADFS